MKRIFLLLLLALSLNSICQTAKISGLITDESTKSPVIDAKVYLLKDNNVVKKTLSDVSGNYILNEVSFGKHDIQVIALGYDTLEIEINVKSASIKQNIMLGENRELDEIKVIGNIVTGQNVPVAVTKIPLQKITEELASRDLPMLLNGTAGVYATQQGGGDGDARINVRGFDQRNVGVMIDGVPVNDMENGAVYWSNWFGLDAITSQMQVQRGLGATKIAMPSIGGTINIITQGIGNKKGGSFKQEYGTGNMLRSSFSYNTGMSQKGWGFTVSASYKQGQGWVYGTPSQGFFGYAKISKKVNDHLVTLSAFAAPQWHGQRSFNQSIQYFSSEKARELGLSIDSTQQFLDMGIRFNQHWGYRTNENGEREILNERRNFYSKPQITLKDFWKVNKKLSISNLAYMSIGRGGGTSLINSSTLRDSTGLIDWDLIEQENKVSSLFGTPNVNTNYHPTQIQSSQILISSMNNHFWVGYLGQFNYEYSKKLEFSGGIDYRYYEGRHYQRVEDLLGGDYYIDKLDKNAPSPMKRVGDKVAKNTFNADRNGNVQWSGAFGQMEYNGERISTFVNISGIINGYQGIDYFQKRKLEFTKTTYDKFGIAHSSLDTTIYIGYSEVGTEWVPDTIEYNGQIYTNDSPGLEYQRTAWKYLPGFTFKSGVSFKVNKSINVYTNIGYLNRTPMFSNVIDNNTNKFFAEIVNEKILAIEGGVNYTLKNFGINLNGYATNWKNKPIPYGVQVYDPQDPTEFIRVNINGMDAVHLGGEIDIAWNITKQLNLEAMFSYGNWYWNSTKTVFIPQYDSLEFSFDAKGVHVGDAAQTATSMTLRYEPIKNLYFKVQAQYFDRYYANFDPFTLQGNNARKDSWKMPGYSLINLFAGYKYPFKSFTLIGSGSITNVLNTVYISDASNNMNGNFDNFDAQSATVMFGGGFRFNVSLGIQF